VTTGGRRVAGRRLGGAVVTPSGLVADGVVEVEAGLIAAVRPRRTGERVHRRASFLLPGFVDLHVHGGGGSTFTTGDPDQAAAVVAFHRRHGSTTMLASLVTAGGGPLTRAVRALQPMVATGELAGVHLEGPYLSRIRRGAHDPDQLRDPDPVELAGLIGLGGVRMMTLAPELTGSLDAIGQLVTHEVLAAVGHTDASYEQTLDAVQAGARVATHLGNAMRPIHHRDPGPVVALLNSAEVVCELVADGVHLHDGMLGYLARTAGPDRVALVTDAMAAAGQPDGGYALGGLPVVVTGGVARLADGGAIAGSTLTMAAALRHIVHCGFHLVEAARMSATTPARVLGLAGTVGALTPGLRADIVLADQNLQVSAVWRAGEPIR
jgi:N-acetylglucosamine-6-phosphate deacetylase